VEIHFYWDKILVFTIYSKKLFWAQENFGGTKDWGTLPPNAPKVTGPLQSNVFALG